MTYSKTCASRSSYVRVRCSNVASNVYLERVPQRYRVVGLLIAGIACLQCSELLSRRKSFASLSKIVTPNFPFSLPFVSDKNSFKKFNLPSFSNAGENFVDAQLPRLLEQQLLPSAPPARRIVVMGLYNSGSSALAEVLQ